MERNILKINNDSMIFNGFKLLEGAQDVNVMILGFGKVVITRQIPEKLLGCHNIIELNNKICNDKEVIGKMREAGIFGDSPFIETKDSYIYNFVSKEIE